MRDGAKEREDWAYVGDNKVQRGREVFGKQEREPEHHDGREDRADLPHLLHGSERRGRDLMRELAPTHTMAEARWMQAMRSLLPKVAVCECAEDF